MSVKAIRQPVIRAVVEDNDCREALVASLLHDLSVLVDGLGIYFRPGLTRWIDLDGGDRKVGDFGLVRRFSP